MTPQDVLKLCKEKKVQFIDLRFMDFPGLWQHTTCPISELSMDSFDHTRYWVWEKEVAEPALVNAGFVVSGWSTTEADSFGPLTRCAHVSKDGVVRQLIYG